MLSMMCDDDDEETRRLKAVYGGLSDSVSRAVVVVRALMSSMTLITSPGGELVAVRSAYFAVPVRDRCLANQLGD